MSDIMDFLIWSEVSEHNDQLREYNRLAEELLHAQNQANRRQRIQQEEKLSKDVSKLFEQFHRKHCDETALSATFIADLERRLFERYKEQRSSRSMPSLYKPKPALKPIIVPLVIIAAIAPFYSVQTRWYSWVLMGVLIFYLVLGLRNYRADKKRRASQERLEHELIEKHTLRMQALKRQFPNLYAYGLWLKYYIDTAVEPAIKVLKRQGSLQSHDEALRRFYLLFGMHADPTLEYDREMIEGMGYWHAKIFENGGT